MTVTHEIKFGTGGWRAFIGEEFTKANVQLFAQAIANIMIKENAQEKGIVIGYDRRFLSDKAAVWFSEVIAGNGIKVLFIYKISPTPLTMFAVQKLNAKYGVEITASHNPADYNGIKIFIEGGKDATHEVTLLIEEEIQKTGYDNIKSMDFENGKENGIIQGAHCFNEYIDKILDMIDIKAIRDKGLKILLDPMHGVSKTSLQTILVTARCELDLINERHDTLFGGRLPAPTTSTLRRLSDLVIEKGYDIGIATDGDADRVGIIDEKGSYIHPNNILVLLYHYLLKYKGWKGGVVRNLCTTHILDRIASACGEKCYEVPVGFKHISYKMEEKDALIGGESSGGLTIRGHIKGKDGIFASSLLVEMICVTGKHLSELLDEIYNLYGRMYVAEKDFKFSREKKEELTELLFVEKKTPDFRREIKNIHYFDGLKIEFADGGWIVCRFSGTENLLRIADEMNSEEDAEQVNDIMKDFLGL